MDPHFEHEGEEVVRWITGGNQPDLHVTFHHEGDCIVVRCASCQETLGSMSRDDKDDQAQALDRMRLSGHPHQ